MISKRDIQEAHIRIAPYIHRTPILTNLFIDELVQAQLFFKCENFQKIGAFKARGAFNFSLQLAKEALHNGLCTHSSGNHAQAIALVAKKLDTKAYIVMPETAPKVKIAAVLDYGAEVTFCEPTLDAREYQLSQIQSKTGATFVPPYDHEWIIAGQATAAKELIEDVDDLDILIPPVGGGGLLAGTALTSDFFSKAVTFGAEPEGADDAFRSLQAGKLIPSTEPNTIADGLLTSLGKTNFPIIQRSVENILLASDKEIVAAMRLIWERMKIIVEPSCALPLAAILRNKKLFSGKRVGVILSGGNVDLEKLPFSR